MPEEIEDIIALAEHGYALNSCEAVKLINHFTGVIQRINAVLEECVPA